MRNYFFILEGRNGATYILNCSSLHNLNLSFLFYRANSTKQKFFKIFVIVYIFILSLLNRVIKLKTFKTIDQIEFYFDSLDISIIPCISRTCSILISPTRDKIIVHHHGNHFHKLAFGKSYHNVRREAEVYQMLSSNNYCFSISQFYDFKDNIGNYCSFKMVPPCNSEISTIDHSMLCSPLVEFFNVSKNRKVDLAEVVSNIKVNFADFSLQGVDNNMLDAIAVRLNKLQNHGIPLGLVHGDFKTWNVLNTKPLTIFDFEESHTDGLPLEDYINFTVDPIVRYQDAETVAKLVFAQSSITNYKKYLYNIDCNLDYKVLVYLYLFGRIDFWAKQGGNNTARSYYHLLKFIDNSEFKLDV